MPKKIYILINWTKRDLIGVFSDAAEADHEAAVYDATVHPMDVELFNPLIPIESEDDEHLREVD